MKKSLIKLVTLPVLVAIPLSLACGFTERSKDLTESEDFAPLVGLCLVTDAEMALSPIGDEVGFFLFPMTGVQHMKSESDFVTIDRKTRIVVQAVEFHESFDDYFLSLWGTVSATDENNYSRARLNELFDYRWRLDANDLVARGRPVSLDSGNLPLRWEYVSLCLTEGDDPESPSETAIPTRRSNPESPSSRGGGG